MTIQNIAIPYSDFKLQEIIDPEQFDLNNATFVTKVNQLVNLINDLTDGDIDGIGGADLVSVRTITPFTSTNLQALVQEILTYLKSTSGADYIGVSAIAGLSGTTTQQFFASVKSLYDSLDVYTGELQSEIDLNVTSIDNLNTKFIVTDGKSNTALTKATNAEAQSTSALSLSTQKANEMDVLMGSVSDLLLYINQTFLVDVTNTLAEYDGRIEDAEALGASVVATANTALTQSNTALTESSSAVTKANGAVATVNSMVTTVNTATNNANTATTNANIARTNAVTATSNATTATTNAVIATNDANTARNATLTATTNAINATNSANTSATSANTQATFAQTQGGFAKTQGEFAQNQATVLSGKQANVDKAIVDSGVALGKATTAEINSTTALNTANLAQARADNVIASSGTSSTEQVDSRLGADLVTRATSGTLIREIHAQQLESARQTTTLINGVSVISGGVDALAETEIEGRTLISLANSNLEASKQYVIADKKTKVIVDNVTQAGVAKFTKGTTTFSTANFLNKVSGSTFVNPHVAKSNTLNGTIASIQPPNSSILYEINGGGSAYPSISTLNGSSWAGVTNANGSIAQQLFSFDIIAEIERKIGIIPKSTLAEKVQWVKDNVESLVANWHGFGSSVGGNKATLARWLVNSSTWQTKGSNVSTTPSAIQIYEGDPPSIAVLIDVNGFVHYLAFADASDGVVSSSISTDYIDLVVTLKATAQLNTRPTIIRVENFEGKVSGSVVENAHKAFGKSDTSTLTIPSAFTSENSQARYDQINKLDGTIANHASTSVSGNIAQNLFSFNLIEAIERNVGKIPRTSVADKVQWIKDNVSVVKSNWHGFGSSVGGSKASVTAWVNGNAWYSSPTTTTSSTVTKITFFLSGQHIDANGFVHFLAYAEPSDGTTASTINTDYIDLEIELKPTADFTRPKVALYEVTADSYAKILVDWNTDAVVNRYPSVEGVQHLQGVGVIAEGENLLPPFTEWTLHANAKVISPYELELNATVLNQVSYFDFKAIKNTNYALKVEHNGRIGVYDTSGVTAISPYTLSDSLTFNSGNYEVFRVYLNSTSTIPNTFKFKNPMLTLGTTAKPFVPRNPSYLYADVKLGAIGTVADRLYEQDGAKFVRKVVEKDVVLDGSLAWIYQLDDIGFKRFKYPSPSNIKDNQAVVSKFDGKYLKNSVSITDGFVSYAGDFVQISASDTDTGFGETYTPSVVEIKAYFYGYKMNNGTFGTPYNGTGTKTWIPISDTTNARAVTVVPTSASPTQLDGTIQPYKLSYVLATPQVINVTDKVEGQLKVNGLTQVEVLSGIVRREKVTPVKVIEGSGTYYHINRSGGTNISGLSKRPVAKFLAVYKNGLIDNRWAFVGISSSITANNFRASVLEADYDPTAEYTVTYIALDKPLLTANPTNIKLLYANNMRSSLEDAVGKVQDNTTQLSVHEKAIVDLYIRVKALEG